MLLLIIYTASHDITVRGYCQRTPIFIMVNFCFSSCVRQKLLMSTFSKEKLRFLFSCVWIRDELNIGARYQCLNTVHGLGIGNRLLRRIFRLTRKYQGNGGCYVMFRFTIFTLFHRKPGYQNRYSD
jgi:hypothetical protein